MKKKGDMSAMGILCVILVVTVVPVVLSWICVKISEHVSGWSDGDHPFFDDDEME